MKVTWNSLIRDLSRKSSEIVAASNSATLLDKNRQIQNGEASTSIQTNSNNAEFGKPLDARTSEVTQSAKIGESDLTKAMNELMQTISRTNEESLRAIAANIRA